MTFDIRGTGATVLLIAFKHVTETKLIQALLGSCRLHLLEKCDLLVQSQIGSFSLKVQSWIQNRVNRGQQTVKSLKTAGDGGQRKLPASRGRHFQLQRKAHTKDKSTNFCDRGAKLSWGGGSNKIFGTRWDRASAAHGCTSKTKPFHFPLERSHLFSPSQVPVVPADRQVHHHVAPDESAPQDVEPALALHHVHPGHPGHRALLTAAVDLLRPQTPDPRGRLRLQLHHQVHGYHPHLCQGGYIRDGSDALLHAAHGEHHHLPPDHD